MLANGIVPCTPAVDVGFDLVAATGSAARRVQVKTVGRGKRWRILRKRTGNTIDGSYLHSPQQSYQGNEFDFFVFVRIEDQACYVVPTSVALKNKTSVTLEDDSPWRGAWGALAK